MRALRPALITGIRGLRLLLAGVLLYAALGKWASPQAFAENVANYRLLPAAVVPVFAASVLGLETLLGLLLLSGFFLEEAALAAMGLFGAFALAIGSALVRNLKIECGCFGAGGSPATTLSLLKDLGLLGGAAALFFFSRLSRRITAP